MNKYKYKAYIGIRNDISAIRNIITEKSYAIDQKKKEIEQLENEIAEFEKSLQLAVNFKNELENGENLHSNNLKNDCHNVNGSY